MTTLRNLVRIPIARVAILVLLAVGFLAVFGEALAPHDPLEQYPAILKNPGGDYLLGTDYVGRDVFSRLMAGTRLSVIGAVEAVAVALVIGVPSGLASAWMGRVGEWVALRLSETLMILPFTVFAIAVAGTLGNGLHQAMIAVGVLTSPVFFRITRAVALGLRTTQYVEAAELMGASHLWVLRKHIWSKVTPNVAVAGAQAMGQALLIVASLAFLGLGVVPPAPTWGGMLAADLGYLQILPWAPLFPAVLLMVTVGALNILADCIREASSGDVLRRRSLVSRLLSRPGAGAPGAGESGPTTIGQSAPTTDKEGSRVAA